MDRIPTFKSIHLLQDLNDANNVAGTIAQFNSDLI